MHASKRKAMIASFPAKREYFHGQPMMPLANKVAVLGLLERGADGTSLVRTMTISGTKRNQLQSKIREHVEPGSALYTDSLRSYRNMNDYLSLSTTRRNTSGATFTQTAWSRTGRC